MRKVRLLHRHYEDARQGGEECLDDLLAQLAALTATRAGVVAAQA